jgi:hypothetical protein
MSRVLHAIEKGLRLVGENSDTLLVDILFGTAAPGGDSGEQDAAPLGSLYLRQNGGSSGIYQKIGTANLAADWLLNGTSAAQIGVWRPESVKVVTNDVQGAGTRDLVASPFSDDEGTLITPSDLAVNDYIISDADGTPALLRVSAIASPNVTFVAAATPLSQHDTFVVKYYLPDSGNTQEKEAIANYTGTVMIKLADINWNFADGIGMAAGYAAVNGTVSSADTVNSAIEKLDGNQQDIQTASGIAQGAVNFGSWTSPVDLLFSATATAKALFQRIGDLLMQLRGVSVAGITTVATVDSVPHATVKAVKWLVEVFEVATPANRKAFEVFALNNGTLVDDTVYAKLDLGANFNFSLSVDISGADMRLRAASTTAGVTVTARRIEVIKSVL